MLHIKKTNVQSYWQTQQSVPRGCFSPQNENQRLLKPDKSKYTTLITILKCISRFEQYYCYIFSAQSKSSSLTTRGLQRAAGILWYREQVGYMESEKRAIQRLAGCNTDSPLKHNIPKKSQCNMLCLWKKNLDLYPLLFEFLENCLSLPLHQKIQSMSQIKDLKSKK